MAPPAPPEVRDAWATVQRGRPAVLRCEGDPSGILAALGHPVTESWAVDQLPTGGEVLWFSEGAASEAAADVAIAGAVLFQTPTLIVVSGRRAMDRGLAFGHRISGGEAGDVCPTTVTGLDVPEAVSDLEQAVLDAAAQGRVAIAAALLGVLEGRDADRAARHRWVHIARSFYLARPDMQDVARTVMTPDPGRSRVLAMAGQTTTDTGVALHLLRQAVRSAETDDERADARYYKHRAEIGAGQRAVSDAGEPAHPLFLAMARFGPASREAYRSTEPGPAHAALAELGTDASRGLLGWVDLRYDVQGGDWAAAARQLVATGLVRSAGWMLAESIQFHPDHQRFREGLACLEAPRMARAVELTRLLDTFDAERARRLAPELLKPTNNVVMRCYGRVLKAAAAAVLDDDHRPLGELHRPEIREQLQASFCSVLASAAEASSPGLKARLLALAVDWAEAVEQLTDARATWLRTLADLGSAQLDRVPLGVYALDGELEAGGMGAVWLGEHTRLQQAVAVKFIRPDAIAHADAFADEVAVLATLDHPAVVQVLDVGEVTEATAALSGGALVAGTPYLVMEFVPGGTLTDYRGRLPWGDVRDLLLAVLDALAYVHARGILHRDLKPQNVLVGESDAGLYVRLSDFGLSGQAMQGEVAGTPAYMAPEQFSGVGMGPWSDLYAVGCIATALLAGLPPFLGSANQLRRAHMTRPIPPLETPVPVPDGFDAWRRKLLEKAPEDRFPHARAASLALRALPAVDRAPVELPDAAAPVPDTQTFVLETLVGEPVVGDPTIRPSRAGLQTVLPRQGFDRRPLRPRLPTDRLFGRFPSPCLGQLDVRQAVWDAALRAYEGVSIETLEVGVPVGMSLSRVLGWARRRLRELGVDVAADDRADMQLSETRPERAPGVWVRAVGSGEEVEVWLQRLDPLQAVAQIRLQVDVTLELAWELVGRTHGMPDLIDAVLAEVIQQPGLVPTPGEGDAALTAAGALPERFAAEDAWARSVLADLTPEARAAIEQIAVSPPNSPVPAGVPEALLAGPPSERWVAPALVAAAAQVLVEQGRAEGLHRAALDGDCSGFARGWHLLGVGEPEAAEILLRTALEEGLSAAYEPLQRCLDLQLVSKDDPRRGTAQSVVDPPGLPEGSPVEQLEWVLRHGDVARREGLVDVVLAGRTDEQEGDLLVAMCDRHAL